MSETDKPRVFGGGSMSGIEVRPLSGSQRQTMDLVDLAEAGFRVFRQADLIHEHRPWLIAREDRSVWMVEHGVPAGGYTARTHAVLVDDDSFRWGFLVAARHSGRDDVATADELERRAREQVDAVKRQADERERTLRELRKTARTDTRARLEREADLWRPRPCECGCGVSPPYGGVRDDRCGRQLEGVVRIYGARVDYDDARPLRPLAPWLVGRGGNAPGRLLLLDAYLERTGARTGARE